MSECKLIHPTRTYPGKQNLTYWEGIARETVGSERICMHLLRIPPGARAVAHLHAMHETAIYMIDGAVDTWWGDNLEHFSTARAGDHFYIPANVPHLPWNRGEREAVCIISRTDPHEQESVCVLPDLDARFMERIMEKVA